MPPYGEAQEVKVKTVERTLMLLEIMAEQNQPLSLTHLGQLADLSLSTTYRLLKTLCRNNFVERCKITGHYRLGLKTFLIGNAALQAVDLRQPALPILTKLSQTYHESIFIAVLSNHDIIYSDSIKTSGPIQIGVQTGIPLPACQTSSGKVLLAYQFCADPDQLADYYLIRRLITDKSAFLAELAGIRQQGFATGICDIGSRIKELSVPVYNHLNHCIGAISIFKPFIQETPTEAEIVLLGALKEAGLEISKNLGYTAPAQITR